MKEKNTMNVETDILAHGKIGDFTPLGNIVAKYNFLIDQIVELRNAQKEISEQLKALQTIQK